MFMSLKIFETFVTITIKIILTQHKSLMIELMFEIILFNMIILDIVFLNIKILCLFRLNFKYYIYFKFFRKTY